MLTRISILLALTLALSGALTLEYGIIMDAGSSGTRIYVYQWFKENRPTLFVYQEISPLNATVSNLKTTPGVSSFYNNPTGLNASLAPLISFAQKNIPPTSWNSTILFFKATAGMRLLPQYQQDSILNDIRTILNGSGFLFRPEWARVITGDEEGIYGWVAVNYLESTLANLTAGSYGALGESIYNRPELTTLDLGGASTQVAFIVPNDYTGPDTTKVTFGKSVDFTLYSKSYLGLGVDQVYLSVQNLLISRANFSTNVNNPCNPSNYSEIAKINGTAYNFTGTADYAGCREVVSTFLKNFTGGPIGANKPAIPQTLNFVGFSAFYYTFSFYNISGLNNNPTLGHLYNLTGEICPLSFSQVVAAAAATGSTANFANKYCFYGVFSSELLISYGFDNNTAQINAQQSIGGTEVSYAPGAMVYEANEYYNSNLMPTITSSASLSQTSALASTSALSSGSATGSSTSSQPTPTNGASVNRLSLPIGIMRICIKPAERLELFSTGSNARVTLLFAGSQQREANGIVRKSRGGFGIAFRNNLDDALCSQSALCAVGSIFQKNFGTFGDDFVQKLNSRSNFNANLTKKREHGANERHHLQSDTFSRIMPPHPTGDTKLKADFKMKFFDIYMQQFRDLDKYPFSTFQASGCNCS
ncbi:ectonucleoside triphosphate diphosphohydrolase 1 [Planoprotostelium fungivorum]|uniref:Ectonucleoside triphosphate diphosphohydrolase 1 n=1 Tax=Planoprotostelium fungivorum TaxID=1890364 RepID=A0A2P6P028_9EUKA|nr:ectonucleoside triphosphate diphosphohydrolase 1 [Planoprotostelium fungivorum]